MKYHLLLFEMIVTQGPPMSRKSFSYSDVPDQLLSWSTNQTVPETSSVKDTLSQDIDELTSGLSGLTFDSDDGPSHPTPTPTSTPEHADHQSIVENESLWTS
ncbi:hypothetical protein OS493_034754 [Desmophyllum pertusum]|uniref:Uncharacterized protein n=1 Tax=Desmophyllum pertusum TaxID=174260 RepID=A0A9W9YV29_9CNID|nr:hypothetical protein OS493_034754 [Desmophyllum pertusum]